MKIKTPFYWRTTWHQELRKAFQRKGDNFDQMISTFDQKALHREVRTMRCKFTYDNDDALVIIPETDEISFRAWGEKYVYFLWIMDEESEGWYRCAISSVERNPPISV